MAAISGSGDPRIQSLTMVISPSWGENTPGGNRTRLPFIVCTRYACLPDILVPGLPSGSESQRASPDAFKCGANQGYALPIFLRITRRPPPHFLVNRALNSFHRLSRAETKRGVLSGVKPSPS